MTREADGVMPSRRLQPAADEVDELAAALADGARAQHADGDLRASRQSFERAYRLAEQAGDGQAMALAALGLAGLWLGERRTVTSAVLLEARLQHVLSLLDAGSVLALRVRTRLAGEADYSRGSRTPRRGAEHRPSLPARPGPHHPAPGAGRPADQGELPDRPPQ